MKKIYFLICLTVLSIAGFGQQLLLEPFNYVPDATNGLANQSSGVWVRINSGDSVLVTSGSLSYTGLPASTGNKISFDGSGSDNYTGFTMQSTGSVYGSFILNISSLGTLGTTGGYFTTFLQDASTSAFGGVVWARASATTGKYNIGISTRSSSSPVSWLPNDLDPGVSYFIVWAYDMVAGTANDVARIWLNPVPGAAEPVASATAVSGTGDLANVGRILLRQDNATNTPFINMDELRVGTTWASVTPGAAPTPSLTASTLAGFNNVCINTSSLPDSFDITGSNLTAADVTVGALAGYSFSTSYGGTYTSSLNLPQPGGAFSQRIYVIFTPTAVQNYNGNIAVGGGGATPVNVAATGAGVNTAPGVTTGGASAITTSSATAAGTINTAGCSAVSAYGIEYSTTSGFANGTGTQVPSTNLSGGNFTSSLSGLNAGTTYYYKAYATNAGGTTYGSELSFTTTSFSPNITVTSLAGFGNVCVNTSSTVNSFTINGTNLTNANITVGPLAGYSFATTAAGPFTSSLTLTQPGGTYTQQVFVQFNPTAIQSYNGDIPVTGGGTSGTTNVAVTGSGVNSAPSVATGGASSIATTSATLAGTISSQGCSAVTAYGIEYSTISGFANGTGTNVPSSNLSGTGFSSNITGLTASTTYYYKAYATNGGGTTYGNEQSFTTAAPPPPVLTATTLAGFGTVCVFNTAGPNSFTITGNNLNSGNITVGPLTGYTFSTSANGTYTSSLTINQTGGSFNQVVYVRFSPVAGQSYNGNIPVTGGGAAAMNVPVTATGSNAIPGITTGPVTNITTRSAVATGTVNGQGCTAVTEYGIEYSVFNNFTPGTGIRAVAGTGVTTGSFSVPLNSLVQGTTYYLRAYASNSGGTAYGDQQTLAIPAIANGFAVYPVPARIGHEISFSMNNVKPGYIGFEMYNMAGQQVVRKHFNTQADFINERFALPHGLGAGMYVIRIINDTEVLGKRLILVTNN